MVIVETVAEFETVLTTIDKQDILLIPILVDAKTHPVVNPLCVLGLFTRVESYYITIDHNDGQSVDPSLLLRLNASQRVWAPSKKVIGHVLPHLANVTDLQSVEYLQTGHITEGADFYTDCHRRLYNLYTRQVRINKSIPLMKHIQFLDAYVAHLWSFAVDVDTSAFRFLNDIAIPATQFLESAGVHIEPTIAEERFSSPIKRFITNELMYSEYNLYTTTGRPSNKFGGVNFAAINKHDGSRLMYTSRFENGILVLSDFESFHLRLIADMIGFDLPTDIPVHEFLGRQYFGKTELTPDEYDQGKQITFKLLYGESRDTNVPEFFTAVYQYIDMLMVLLDRHGYVVSPYYKREIRKENIENPTPSKVFNYMIQLAETESNLAGIQKLRTIYDGKMSRPTLYTYDSLLIDYNMDDGPELLTKTIEILSQNGKFPMRVYYGTTYNELKRLSL